MDWHILHLMIPEFNMHPIFSGHLVELISSVELRVAELIHHLKIESAVVVGAKNVVKHLSGQKIQDRRVLAEVGASAQSTFTLDDTVGPVLFLLSRNNIAT